jgi:electron transport complex protein RnfB
MTDNDVIDKINNVLPQTQCRQCTYKDCLSYAKAIVKGDRLDRCIPGADATIIDIAKIVNKDPSPFLNKIIKKESKKVIIDSNNCIGCIKCIMACPVDAIIGSRQNLHEIIEDECTGCNLCIPACPTDCIIETNEDTNYSFDKAKHRYEAKVKRLDKDDSFKSNIENSTVSIKLKQDYINKVLKKDVIKSKNS